jgi:hypothetical protein
MPKIDGESKGELLSTRVTTGIKEAVTRESRREGLTASEWLRTLIVKELKEREALPSTYRFPGIETR